MPHALRLLVFLVLPLARCVAQDPTARVLTVATEVVPRTQGLCGHE